jgi:hypothetical protein
VGTGFVQYNLISTNGGDTTAGISTADGAGNDNGSITIGIAAAAIPEPASMILMGVGFAGVAGARLIRRKKGQVTV